MNVRMMQSSFGISRCNVPHGTRSEALLRPNGGRSKFLKIRICISNAPSGNERITFEKPDYGVTALIKGFNSQIK